MNNDRLKNEKTKVYPVINSESISCVNHNRISYANHADNCYNSY